MLFASSVFPQKSGMIHVSASYDATLKIWDLLRGTEVRTLSGPPQPFYAVAVTPDGRWAISGSVKILSVWDLEHGVEVRTLKGHTAEVSAVAVTPDGRQAISASNDYTLKVWDLEHGVEVRTLKGHTDFVRAAVVPNSQLAISASWDTSIRVWNLEFGKVIARFNGDDRLFTCSTALDQGIIAAGSASGQIHILQLER